MSQDRAEVTEIDATGLRYKSKANGSPYGAPSTPSGTMSCMKCGIHKPRALGSFKRLLNQSMFFCGDCRPTKLTKEAL